MLSNIWNHPVTSFIGLLLGIVAVANALLSQGVTLGNLGSGTVISLVVAVATALLGLLAKDPTAQTSGSGSSSRTGLVFLLVAGVMLLCALPSCAQSATTTTTTAASSGTGLTTSSSALDIYYKGSPSAGNLTREQFDFLDYGPQKTNRIYAEANQLFAPTPGLSLYTFGAGWQPDLTKFFAKTNITPSNFSTEFNSSIGVGEPAKGSGGIAFLFGGVLSYKVSSSVTFKALEFDWGGTGAQKITGVSAGVTLTNLFGSK